MNSDMIYQATLAANALTEHAIYREETALWYRLGDVCGIGVVADTYPEAFEKLYGHPVVIPPPARAPRKESIV